MTMKYAVSIFKANENRSLDPDNFILFVRKQQTFYYLFIFLCVTSILRAMITLHQNIRAAFL